MIDSLFCFSRQLHHLSTPRPGLPRLRGTKSTGGTVRRRQLRVQLVIHCRWNQRFRFGFPDDMVRGELSESPRLRFSVAVPLGINGAGELSTEPIGDLEPGLGPAFLFRFCGMLNRTVEHLTAAPHGAESGSATRPEPARRRVSGIRKPARHTRLPRRSSGASSPAIPDRALSRKP